MGGRIVDILVALVVLVFLSPLFLLIALIIRLDSRGGVFYRGWRIGKDGKPFRMLKFRTMVASADRIGPQITAARDSRVTRVGSVLRNTKLDELPQFWNLLCGDITLIGPRPESPAIVAHYTPEQRKILAVKPGLTGPTQLYYTTLEANAIKEMAGAEQYYIEHLLPDKLAMDAYHLHRRTAGVDLSVLLRTAILMFRTLLGQLAAAWTGRQRRPGPRDAERGSG